MTNKEILDLIDSLRARGVHGIELVRGDFKLSVVGIPRLNAGELPDSAEARAAMLRDPNVADDVKKRILEEDERDLYGSA